PQLGPVPLTVCPAVSAPAVTFQVRREARPVATRTAEYERPRTAPRSVSGITATGGGGTAIEKLRWAETSVYTASTASAVKPNVPTTFGVPDSVPATASRIMP